MYHATRQSPPDFVLLSQLEQLLLLLPDHLQRVDEGAAPVERVSGHQDEGGLGAPICGEGDGLKGGGGSTVPTMVPTLAKTYLMRILAIYVP